MKYSHVLELGALFVIVSILLALLWKKFEELFEAGIEQCKSKIPECRAYWQAVRDKYLGWQKKHLPVFSFIQFSCTLGVTIFLIVAAYADYKLLTATFAVMFAEEYSTGTIISQLFAVVFVMAQALLGLFISEFLGWTDVIKHDNKLGYEAREKIALVLVCGLAIVCAMNSYIFVWRIESNESVDTSPVLMGALGFVLPVIMAVFGYVIPFFLGQVGIGLSWLCHFFILVVETAIVLVISLFIKMVIILRVILRIISWIGELIIGLFRSEPKDTKKAEIERKRYVDRPPAKQSNDNGKEVDEEVERFFRGEG